jgi:hypothetical protein
MPHGANQDINHTDTPTRAAKEKRVPRLFPTVLNVKFAKLGTKYALTVVPVSQAMHSAAWLLIASTPGGRLPVVSISVPCTVHVILLLGRLRPPET